MRWLDDITESWTWVWASSRSWWWTGKPGMLQSIASQRIRHNWMTELNWTDGKKSQLKKSGKELNWVAAAAAAKLLQSCPALCDPIDGSPPGSPVPGILQARTLDITLNQDIKKLEDSYGTTYLGIWNLICYPRRLLEVNEHFQKWLYNLLCITLNRHLWSKNSTF